MDRNAWPSLKEKLAAVIKTKTRDEWDAIMLGSDVCYAPVLTLAEAPKHPHNVARKTFVEVDGVVQPAPAPRFSRTVPRSAGTAGRRRQRGRAQGLGLRATPMSRNCKAPVRSRSDAVQLPGTVSRRRIYLMRHGHVDYFAPSMSWRPARSTPCR